MGQFCPLSWVSCSWTANKSPFKRVALAVQYIMFQTEKPNEKLGHSLPWAITEVHKSKKIQEVTSSEFLAAVSVLCLITMLQYYSWKHLQGIISFFLTTFLS